MPKIGTPRPSGGAAAPSPGAPWIGQLGDVIRAAENRTPPEPTVWPHEPADHRVFNGVRVCICACPECWPDGDTPCPWERV